MDLNGYLNEVACVIRGWDNVQDHSVLIHIKRISNEAMRQIERENRHVVWISREKNKEPFARLKVEEVNRRLDIMTRQVHKYPKMVLKIRHSVLSDMQSLNTKADLERNMGIFMNPRLYLAHLKAIPRDYSQIEMWKDRVWGSLRDAGFVETFLGATEDSSD